MATAAEPERMTGNAYAALICRYLCANYGDRGIDVYTQIVLGKTIIGKDRHLDVLLVHKASARAFALECKYQSVAGTADEKIPYALDDLRAMRTPGCLVYAGSGFSPGILHLLRASDLAAYCLPGDSLRPTPETRELDHRLAEYFGWWDVIVRDARRFQP
jgi:hypothetical protein